MLYFISFLFYKKYVNIRIKNSGSAMKMAGIFPGKELAWFWILLFDNKNKSMFPNRKVKCSLSYTCNHSNIEQWHSFKDTHNSRVCDLLYSKVIIVLIFFSWDSNVECHINPEATNNNKESRYNRFPVHNEVINPSVYPTNLHNTKCKNVINTVDDKQSIL